MNFRALASLVVLPTVGFGQSPTARLAAAPPTILESGPDTLLWQSVSPATDTDGRAVLVTNTWEELATGLTYFDDARQARIPTVEAFEVSADGRALALRGPHRVAAAPNLHSWGAVEVQTPEGQTFRSHLLGIAYTDPPVAGAFSSPNPGTVSERSSARTGWFGRTR